MEITTVYHWSPADRHEAILADGLKPRSAPTTSGVAPEDWAKGFGDLCFGTSPSAAWRLSGGMDYVECEEWDLWEVRLAEGDEVHVRSEFGPTIIEVRTRNAIPADRVWWVGQR